MKKNHLTISLKWMIILALGIFNLSIAQKKVIAYMPNWIDLNTFSNSIQYNKLTHINIAFENPDANGYLSFNSGSNSIIQAAHAKNVKVFVSLGGGSISEGGAIRDNYFNLITANNRTAFIQKIYDYVVAHNFDGVDVDLEGPAINGDYGGFVIALANKLHANGKLISAALSEGYGGANVPASTFAAYDWINIMAYDATGPWAPGNPGPHSPYSMAVNQFNYWTGRGLPASKAIIGLPFYGYGFGAAANQGISYANIINQYPGAENADQVGNTIYYNGIPTIKAKTTFAIQNAGGVMIWELSQDAVGPKSLLTAINDVINVTQPPQNGVATVYKDCNYGGYSVGLAAENYTLGQLQAKGILDNDISSLKVQNGYEVVLYANDNFSGTSIIVTSDNTCLVANSFNDAATSLRVRAITNSSSVLIQAENYSAMSGIQTEPTTDTGGGLNVGYADTGDWMAYFNINFPTSGSYIIEYRVASATGAKISADLSAGTVQLGSLDVPNTGGWQNWQTISQNVNVNAGIYNFGVFIQNTGVNLNWIRITKSSSALTAKTASIDKALSTDIPNLTIYPNPTEETLFFSAEISGANVIVINSEDGKTISQQNANSNSIDVSSLKSGIYLILVEKDGIKTVRRFIKK